MPSPTQATRSRRGARPARRPADPPLAVVDDPLMHDHYPMDWAEFIGQIEAKRQLRIAAASARARDTTMDHVLLTGPSGRGKTSLALLTARELGGAIRMEAGPIKPHQVPMIFTDMEDGDVLFLDEVHQLVVGGKHNAEWLLPLLQDGKMQTPLGLEPAPKVTVIAATTDAGRLPKTIRDRFGITPTIEPYSDAEGAEIAAQLATKILVREGLAAPSTQVAAAIAQAGNNSPRQMRRILIAVRDLVFAGELKNGAEYELSEALIFAGVTEDGLNAQARLYLLTLFQDFGGAPAGRTAIAERLGEVSAGIAEIEEVLLSKGMIARTKLGRIMTTGGIRRARALANASLDSAGQRRAVSR